MFKISYCIAVTVGIVWLLAVLKMFLSNGDTKNEVIVTTNQKALPANKRPSVTSLKKAKSSRSVIFKKSSDPQSAQVANIQIGNVINKIPKSSEWIFIRSSPKYVIEGSNIIPPAASIQLTADQKQFSSIAITPDLNIPGTLAWPPVLPDGTIPAQDGEDILPILNLKVLLLVHLSCLSSHVCV